MLTLLPYVVDFKCYGIVSVKLLRYLFLSILYYLNHSFTINGRLASSTATEATTTICRYWLQYGDPKNIDKSLWWWPVILLEMCLVVSGPVAGGAPRRDDCFSLFDISKVNWYRSNQNWSHFSITGSWLLTAAGRGSNSLIPGPQKTVSIVVLQKVPTEGS